MNIIAALRTPVATLAVLCMALLAQLPHAADVFRMIVGGEGWLEPMRVDERIPF